MPPAGYGVLIGTLVAGPLATTVNAIGAPKNPPDLGQTGSVTAGTPDGIRTHATGVRGRRPRPLDDGGLGSSLVSQGLFGFSC